MDNFAAYRNSRDHLYRSIDDRNERVRRAPLDDSILKARQQQFDLGQLQLNDNAAMREVGTQAVEQGLSQKETRKAFSEEMMKQGNYQDAVAINDKFTDQQAKERDYYIGLAQEQGKEFAVNAATQDGAAPNVIQGLSSAKVFPDRVEQPDGQGGTILHVRAPGSRGYKSFHVSAPRVASGGSSGFTASDAFAALKTEDYPVQNPDGTPKIDEFGRPYVQTKRFDREKGKLVDEGVPTPSGEITAHMMSMNPKAALKQLGLPESEYESEIMRYLQTGKTGFSSRQQAQRSFVILQADAVAKDLGIDPGDVSTKQEDFKAKTRSLIKQRSRIDALSSYVENMHKQIQQFEELGKMLPRDNPNIVNIPIREWEGSVVGNEVQALLDVHIKEVATENTKIASGAVESIKEVSDSAREEWEKVINKNLSYKKMMYVLNGIKVLGANRLASMNDRYAETVQDARKVFNKEAEKPESQTEKDKPKLPSAEEAPEGAIGWDTEKEEWVY